MENLKMKELYSRNYPLVSLKTQNELARLTVALVGVGLSSQIGHALVRVGIRNLLIWDKDNVSQSNLNRQAFKKDNIGNNKAQVTATNLSDIEDGLNIESFNRHLVYEDIDQYLRQSDIVINSADFETSLVYDINDAMQKEGKWCIQPLNLGFGGACFLFDKESPSLEEMTGGRQTDPVFFIKNLLAFSNGFNPGKELQKEGDSILIEGSRAGWFPQNVIATYITSSLITWAIVKIAEGNADKIKAPGILHFEPGACL